MMGARARLAEVALGVSTVAALPAAGAGDIPPRALQAYVAAAASPEACPGMRWQIPAAVTDRESDHGRHGGSTLGADGVVSPPIYGVPVEWLGGVRAEGPGQFIPSSWGLFGKGDPQDIDDAAMAIVRHLCGTHGDVEGDHLRSALVSYYGADQDGYADGVLAAIADLDRVEPALFATSQTAAPQPKQRTPMRLWDGLVARWVRLGDGAETVGLGGVWRAVDDAMFPGVKVQRARAVSSIASAAEAWVGRDFRPGEKEQCAYFVRQVLRDAGVRLSPEVTAETLDGSWSGVGIANSFGGDQGQVIRSVGDLLPGDIVMFANTYGDWPAGSITHVGIYVGDGMMVDRPTAARPVQRRPVSTFSTFAGAVRL